MFGVGIPSAEHVFLTVLMYCLFIAVSIKFGVRLFRGRSEQPRVDRKLRYLWPFAFLALLPAIIFWILLTMFGLEAHAGVAFLVFWFICLAILCNLVLFGSEQKSKSSTKSLVDSIALTFFAMLTSFVALYAYIAVII